MSAVFHHVFNVILPILLCIGAGLVLARLKQPFDTKMVSSVMANVGYPTLILSHLLGNTVDVQLFLQMLLAAALAVVCIGAVWACALRVLGLPLRVFLSPLSLNNVGNIGLPVCALAVGPAGLTYGLAFVVVVMLFTFTVSQWVTAGNYSLRRAATSPTVYAAVLAVAMLLTGWSFPPPVMAGLTLLGGLAIPLMLLTLGYSLANLQLGNLWLALRLALLHLLVGAAVAFGLLQVFGFTGAARSVLIIDCLMPVSVATYLWVQLYRPTEAPAVAGLVLMTTLLTMIALPLVLTFWI